ncbi:MAG: NAD(P)/FAD-dependent oxidoreductase [Granulosicoccus sp.]
MKLLYKNDRQGEHAPSWYNSSCDSPARASLGTHICTDVCIIGAGFTGLSAAVELRKQGISCVVLDAHRVGWGASGRNGGQLGTGFNMDQRQLEASVGEPLAHAMWEIAEQAKRWILDTCQSHGCNIDYKSGIVSALHRKRFVKPLHDYCNYLQTHYGYESLQPLDAGTIRKHVNSRVYHGGTIDYGAGHIHPLKLAHSLAEIAELKGATIYERTEATSIHKHATRDGHRIVTPSGSVMCQNVILATNGYLDSLNEDVGKRLMPINNFIVVTEPLGAIATELLPQNEAVADSRFVVNYYRRVAGDRLLFGGGENYSYNFPQAIAPLVRRAMISVFPQLQDISIDYAWGGTLAITTNRLPYLAEFSPQQFTAGGYSGHGVSLACIYGKALADRIAGNTTLFDVLSQSPSTVFPGGPSLRPLLLATAMTAYSLLDRI